MNMHNIARLTIAVPLIAGVLSLGACAKNEEGKAAATQVAAKVGSEEITVHQVNQILSLSNNAGGSVEDMQAMGREVLEKLIDQQLALEKATEAKLHRSPEVVSQIEAAKRDILARAYMQQLISGLPRPTESEAKKYYAEHPQLFRERRVFNIEEVIAKPAPDVAGMLRAMASEAKPIKDIGAFLKAHNIPFNGGSSNRSVEEIPLELLSRVYALKDGQAIVLEAPQGVTFLRVVSSQPAPISEAAALPRIQKFLSNQRASEALAAAFKELRANTKIEYMGEFAQRSTVTPATVPVEPAVAKPATLQSTIEKGIAGLK